MEASEVFSLQAESLTDVEVLELLRLKIYEVDLETGRVFGTTIKGRRVEVKQEVNGKAGDYLGIRIKCKGRRRKIAVHVLVWMAGTLSIRPTNWQVHHLDENPLNNTFTNLICLHPMDHQKFHAEDETPF